MDRFETRMPFDTRALECVIVACTAPFAADALRAEFGLLWQILRLLFDY